MDNKLQLHFISKSDSFAKLYHSLDKQFDHFIIDSDNDTLYLFIRKENNPYNPFTEWAFTLSLYSLSNLEGIYNDYREQ